MTHRFGRAGIRFGQTARYAGACFAQAKESKPTMTHLVARKPIPDTRPPTPERPTPDTAPTRPKKIPAILVAPTAKPPAPRCCVVKVGDRHNLSCEPKSHPWHGIDVTGKVSCHMRPQGMMCVVRFADRFGENVLEIPLCPPGKEPPEFKVPPPPPPPPPPGKIPSRLRISPPLPPPEKPPIKVYPIPQAPPPKRPPIITRPVPEVPFEPPMPPMPPMPPTPPTPPIRPTISCEPIEAMRGKKAWQELVRRSKQRKPRRTC